MDKKRIVGFLLLASVLTAQAGTITQEILLCEGWNAFYLDVTPPDGADSPDLLFKELPLTQVACHIDSRLPSGGAIDSEGKPIVGGKIEFFTWIPGDPAASTLLRVVGGAPYYCFATQTCTLRVSGRPALPRMRWRNTAKSGMMNLAGVSIDNPDGVTVKEYFQEGPPGENPDVYQIAGMDPKAPSFLPIRSNRVLKRGNVVAISSPVETVWNGPITVSATHPQGVLLSEKQPISGITIKNTGKIERLIRVSLRKSEKSSEVLPALMWSYKHDFSSYAEWLPFTDVVTNRLGVGESWHLSLTPNLPKMPALTEGNSFAGILRVEAIQDPSCARVLVPVSFEHVAPDANHAAFPQGLWVGYITLLQVNNGKGGEPRPAGSEMKMRAMVHVDENNVPHLLQRVVLFPEQDTPTNPYIRLLQEMDRVPKDRAATRISTLFLDTANRSVPATADRDGNDPEFGKVTTFRFTVSEKSRENPFRHCWHPDHDGKTMDFKSDLPSGDDPQNYIGPIKPEIFSVTNTLTLTWRDIEDKSTYSYNPDQTTYGRCDWTLGGLRSKGEIRMRGVFALKRICSDPTIE